MRRILIIITVFCTSIIGLSIFNNISFNKYKRNKDSIELLRDSLLLRQSELQDSLLQKTIILDSIYLKSKSSDSAIQVDIHQIIDNSKKIIKLQKQIFQENK